MQNLLAHSHSLLVHFTLGLFITGFVVEVIGLVLDHGKTKYAGAIMVITGGLAGFLTMYTGEFAEENVEEILKVSERVLERHEEWGGWTGYLLLVTALVRATLLWIRQSLLQTAYLLLGGISLIAVLITGHYGGKVTHAGHPHATLFGKNTAETPASTAPKEEGNEAEDH